jgi:hypothetical protein
MDKCKAREIRHIEILSGIIDGNSIGEKEMPNSFPLIVPRQRKNHLYSTANTPSVIATVVPATG